MNSKFSTPPDHISFPVVDSDDKSGSQVPHSRPLRTYVVFFLPGNPCVVEFYRTFLTLLYHSLSVDASICKTQIQVQAVSLRGFECAQDQELSASARLPLGIDGQIEFLEETLKASSQPERRVILVGHSLGGYLMMEMIRRNRNHGIPIVGGIALFSPITHLAKSEGAQKYGWLIHVPGLMLLISILARVLAILLYFPLPRRFLTSILAYPDDAVATICHFLQSKWGVRQSLHLIREEMTCMAADKWDEEVWGNATPPSPLLAQPRVPLCFLYGEHDNWVSSIERDRLISTRGRRDSSELEENWKPLFEIDSTGISHDFSIRHGRPVAARVAAWVRDIIHQDCAP